MIRLLAPLAQSWVALFHLLPTQQSAVPRVAYWPCQGCTRWSHRYDLGSVHQGLCAQGCSLREAAMLDLLCLAPPACSRFEAPDIPCCSHSIVVSLGRLLLPAISQCPRGVARDIGDGRRVAAAPNQWMRQVLHHLPFVRLCVRLVGLHLLDSACWEKDCTPSGRVTMKLSHRRVRSQGAWALAHPRHPVLIRRAKEIEMAHWFLCCVLMAALGSFPCTLIRTRLLL